MKIAHVRETSAPAGAAWRLAASLETVEEPMRWLDLEAARRRLVAEDQRRAHNSALFREPISTLDVHLARGLRVDALRDVVEPLAEVGADAAGADLLLEAADLRFGPPILRPPSLRDFYAFEGHVRTMWERRGGTVPEAWYRLPIFYFSNVSEIRGPDEPVWSPAASVELDYELEVAALIDVPLRDADAATGERAIGGYMVFNDWSARDLQREETTVRLGPAKGKDFAASIGPWLVTPDELADAKTETGYVLTMSAMVNGTQTSHGSWESAQFGFGQMVERASADARLRPGDLLGSGTVGSGCLLEVKDETLGRWLQPGDEVVLRVERLGTLRTPIIDRAERPR